MSGQGCQGCLERDARIAALEAQVAALKRDLDELKARQSRTPSNSSTPPSTVHPHAKPVRPRPPASKDRGGQLGHAKHDRPLLPIKQCHAVIPRRPCHCRRCGRRLTGHDPQPLRHQVWEIPEIQPYVTEYQRHRLICAVCGATTTAPLPVGVPTGQSGPRLVAFTALLLAFFRQSKRRAALFLSAMLGQPCSTGLTVKLQAVATDALRPCYDELTAALPDQPHVHADESPTKQGTAKAWLWTVVAASFTVFTLRLSRGAEVIKELLTATFPGVVTGDRAKMYLWVPKLQWCWAHLKRAFQAMADAGRQAQAIGERLLDLTRQLFRCRHRARDGDLSPVGLKRHLHRLYGAVYLALEEGLQCGHAPTAATCRQLLDRYDTLWTFVDHPGVEPTNNAAERALRQAVIWRKLSFGTQSAAGSRFVETLLTVIETCRQQGRDLFAFVTDAIGCHFAAQPAPSLLPKV
jgi:transposase